MVDKITASNIADKIIDLWNMGYSGDKIAKMTGSIVTGRSVLRFLNRNGIQTADTRKLTTCAYKPCGVEFFKTRSVYLRSTSHYHSNKCYYLHLLDPEYIQVVQNSRAVRRIVRMCGYRIAEGEAVYFKDGNSLNHDPSNLLVFANNGDSVCWDKGYREMVKPVWPIK